MCFQPPNFIVRKRNLKEISSHANLDLEALDLGLGILDVGISSLAALVMPDFGLADMSVLDSLERNSSYYKAKQATRWYKNSLGLFILSPIQ